MAFLKEEPAGQVLSMSEFFALARAMEADAAARYTETARQLRQQGVAHLADVFDRLAETERGHIQQVEQWAEHRDEVSLTEAPWPIPDTFDAHPEEVAGSKLMTPYRALASAVRHEQRSFAFWTYVAAHAVNAEVKDAAERMALEELEHVSLLRGERRKAFHVERTDGDSAEEPITLDTLAATELRLAALIEHNPHCAAGGNEIAVSLASAAREAASKLELLDAEAHPRLLAPPLPTERRNDMASMSEYLAEAYLRLAETARDPHVLGVAQELAKAAINRLGMLDRDPQPRTDDF
jgi:rubrerythrin